MTNPTNQDNIIDSRHVVQRIATLEVDGADDDEHEELDALRELAEQGEIATNDWPHGATLIRDSYFNADP